MQNITRYAMCAIALLIASLTVSSATRAHEGVVLDVRPVIRGDQTTDDDSWGDGEDIWFLTGSDVSGGPASAVFVLDGDSIFLNVGRDGEPYWMEITEKEFWYWIELLENKGFGFVTMESSEEVIIVVFIIPA